MESIVYFVPPVRIIELSPRCILKGQILNMAFSAHLVSNWPNAATEEAGPRGKPGKTPATRFQTPIDFAQDCFVFRRQV